MVRAPGQRSNLNSHQFILIFRNWCNIVTMSVHTYISYFSGLLTDLRIVLYHKSKVVFTFILFHKINV